MTVASVSPPEGFGYDELIAAIDRAYAVPAEEPLPLEALFTELRAATGPQRSHPAPPESAQNPAAV
jgi:hypothetical protein